MATSAQRTRARRFWAVSNLRGSFALPNLIVVEVHDRDAHPMLDFARTEIMQQRSPLFVFFQIFGDVFGEKNVSGVPTIHYPLRNVEASPREIGPLV
jgi:hypothetical protein